MLINEVQYKVGLTKKSIRYYEEEGLLSPKRNKDNDYREYSELDLKTLRTIKFLRELNVSIQDIKKLKTKELTLKECMENELKKIEEIENNFVRVKNMCLEIKDSNQDFDSIDITKYLETMNILNKKGFTMKDISKKHKRKIGGAILSSIVFSLFFLFFIVLFTYFQTTEDNIPWPLYIFLIVIFGFPILGIIINLIKRIKEIRGGEEDEASKY